MFQLDHQSAGQCLGVAQGFTHRLDGRSRDIGVPQPGQPGVARQRVELLLKNRDQVFTILIAGGVVRESRVAPKFLGCQNSHQPRHCSCVPTPTTKYRPSLP
jgi:hypothetical protein